MEKLQVLELRKKLVNLALTMAGTQLITVGGGFLCMIMLAQLGKQFWPPAP